MCLVERHRDGFVLVFRDGFMSSVLVEEERDSLFFLFGLGIPKMGLATRQVGPTCQSLSFFLLSSSFPVSPFLSYAHIHETWPTGADTATHPRQAK